MTGKTLAAKAAEPTDAGTTGAAPLVVNALCAGAAQGLLSALQPGFQAQTGAALVARFGAVGALREALLAGEACDLLVVTDAMVLSLAHDGRLQPESRAPLGRVRTGMAVREGDDAPDISTAVGLTRVLRAASGIHYPDPLRATAGVHFADVLRRLGLAEELAPRCHTYPNGATAMRALAASGGPADVGCTQVSEIMFTPGVRLIGSLPPGFELVTAYSAALTQAAAQPELALALIALLAGEQTQALRDRCGFEPGAHGA